VQSSSAFQIGLAAQKTMKKRTVAGPESLTYFLPPVV